MTLFTKKKVHTPKKQTGLQRQEVDLKMAGCPGEYQDATSNVIFSTSLVQKMRPTIAAYVY